VTLRVRSGLPSLRSPALFAVVRKALAAGKDRFGFRLAQFSVQGNHLHLLVEAEQQRALSRGVQGLSVRLARALNRRLERSGSLFADRYHARALKTPRSVQLALRYVLLNARKHARASMPPGFVDARSSAPWFDGFCRPSELVFGARAAREEWAWQSGALDAPVVAARSWLLRVGYQRAGPIDCDDAPAPG
jgi:REP element-mobilizing transposase RayT